MTDFDHTSFAVHDALEAAGRLRRELGAVPVMGEELAEFRYLLLHVGTAEEGGRVEVLEPTGPGFLTEFLDRRGEGPHHLTFNVTDLEESVALAREAGFTVVGEDLGHAPWREAFLAPDRVHGTVVQLAQSDRSYPDRAELRTTRERDSDAMPSSRGATRPDWWHAVWDEEPGTPAVLGATRLVSTDLGRTRALFGDLLGGSESEGCYSWPGGSVRVSPGDRPGITGIDVNGTRHECITQQGVPR